MDLNGTQAAIRAGYAESGASVQAARLLGNARIKEELARRMQERSERTKVDADWVLQWLARTLQADIRAVFREDGSLVPVREWPDDLAQLLSGMDVAELWEGAGDDRRQTGVLRKVKFLDKARIIELIGKHIDVSAFRENVALHDGLAGRILEARQQLEDAGAFDEDGARKLDS